MVHDTQSAQQAQSKEHNTYIVKSWRWAHWIVFITSPCMYYAPCFSLFDQSVCHEPISVLINVIKPSRVLVEHSVGSNTNKAWTPPLAIHSRHVASKPLWRWGGWVDWVVFMASLCMYYAPCFALVEQSVCHGPISVLINVFKLLA